MSLPDFFVAHKREVLTLTGEHLWLVGSLHAAGRRHWRAAGNLAEPAPGVESL